jgi:hypothetical protein
VPSGISSITVTAKGAGGAGGLEDNMNLQTVGTNGNLVTRVISVTPGSQLTVYVAAGGNFNDNVSQVGAGGFGYHYGSDGAAGEGPNGDAWSYGGAGGGGSSAVILSSTLLVEAAGGAGGRSDDYDDIDNWFGDGGYYHGGAGGAGGGIDYPAVTTIGGGGGGGYYRQAGANGSVSITF